MRIAFVFATLLFASASFAQSCDSGTAIACGATVSGSLATSDCDARDSSRYDVWQFAGKSGDSITIDMASAAFAPYIVLVDPANVPVAESESRITFTLTASGTWTVIANSLTATQSGDYTLSLSCPIAAAPGPRRRAAGK
jgi:hypothetical protein